MHNYSGKMLRFFGILKATDFEILMTDKVAYDDLGLRSPHSDWLPSGIFCVSFALSLAFLNFLTQSYHLLYSTINPTIPCASLPPSSHGEQTGKTLALQGHKITASSFVRPHWTFTISYLDTFCFSTHFDF